MLKKIKDVSVGLAFIYVGVTSVLGLVRLAIEWRNYIFERMGRNHD